MIDENTQKERTSREFMFKARQPLGVPQVVIPPKAGYVQAIVQFIVAGLNVSKHEEENILSLCNQLGIEIVLTGSPIKRHPSIGRNNSTHIDSTWDDT
jgi:hypothetical protein